MSAPDPTASMSPDELIAVIERGLDDDEQTACGAGNRRWLVEDNMISLWPEREDDGFMSWPTRADARHAYRHDPSRVLADVESKRAQMAELESLPHYAWEGRGEYGCPKFTDAETWAEVMGDAEQVCTCGRDAHVARILRALARPYLDQESPPAMGADAGDESPCGYVRETWDGPYRMRDRCTAAAGHRGGHGPWEMTS